MESTSLNAIAEQLKGLTDEEIRNRLRVFESNMKQFKPEENKIAYELKKAEEELKDNRAKIKQNKQLPWLVSNIVEILDIPPEQDEDGQTDPD